MSGLANFRDKQSALVHACRILKQVRDQTRNSVAQTEITRTMRQLEELELDVDKYNAQLLKQGK